MLYRDYVLPYHHFWWTCFVKKRVSIQVLSLSGQPKYKMDKFFINRHLDFRRIFFHKICVQKSLFLTNYLWNKSINAFHKEFCPIIKPLRLQSTEVVSKTSMDRFFFLASKSFHLWPSFRDYSMQLRGKIIPFNGRGCRIALAHLRSPIFVFLQVIGKCRAFIFWGQKSPILRQHSLWMAPKYKCLTLSNHL